MKKIFIIAEAGVNHNGSIELAKKQRIKIKINIPKNIPLIVVDKQKLIQVLNHIIDNSIKFIGNGDMITISAKKIINSTKKKEKFIEITFSPRCFMRQ